MQPKIILDDNPALEKLDDPDLKGKFMEALNPLNLSRTFIPEAINNSCVRSVMSQLETPHFLDSPPASEMSRPLGGSCHCAGSGADLAGLTLIINTLSKLIERLQQLLKSGGGSSTETSLSSGDSGSGLGISDFIPGLSYSELPGASPEIARKFSGETGFTREFASATTVFNKILQLQFALCDGPVAVANSGQSAGERSVGNTPVFPPLYPHILPQTSQPHDGLTCNIRASDKNIYGNPDCSSALMPSGASAADDTAARELSESGRGNIFSQAWQDEISQAASGSRGLGNASDGYLAWSEKGFIYFNNPNLTADQNKKLAEVSLVTGVAIEKTPARSDKSSTIPEISKWVNDFIHGHEKAIQRFIDNPLEGYVVRDGRKKIEMNIAPDTGTVATLFSRKRGGLAGLIERNTQSIAGLADFAAISTFFMPPAAKLFGVLPAGLSRVGSLVSRLMRPPV